MNATPSADTGNISTEHANIRHLVHHFMSGCKPGGVLNLGLEVEHFIVHRKDRSAVTYYEDRGVEWILRRISAAFPHIETSGDHIIGCRNSDYSISIEPAAQIEISISPRKCIKEILSIYSSFLDLISPVLEECGYDLVTLGYQPQSCVKDLPLIPKKRYEYMDHYFREVDTLGPNMMRGTASTQISIDYSSEDDFVRKMRCAYLLMPAIKLLTDNAPVFEGKPAARRMMRTEIWYHVDPDRCGIIPGLFEDSFGFNAYAEYIWNLPLIFLPSENGPEYTGSRTVSSLWSDRLFTDADVDHVLSMVFPDVRLKHYVEIRGADSMPVPCVAAYLALIKGIFFHSSVINSILDQYQNVREADILRAEQNLINDGYDGIIYDMPARKFIDRILKLAASRLPADEAAFLDPFRALLL